MTLCQQCGDSGFADLLAVCQLCNNVAVHQYCLEFGVVFNGESIRWSCEDCWHHNATSLYRHNEELRNSIEGNPSWNKKRREVNPRDSLVLKEVARHESENPKPNDGDSNVAMGDCEIPILKRKKVEKVNNLLSPEGCLRANGARNRKYETLVETDGGGKPVQSSGNLSRLALPNIRIDGGVSQDRRLDTFDAPEEGSALANATAEQKSGTIPGQLSSNDGDSNVATGDFEILKGKKVKNLLSHDGCLRANGARKRKHGTSVKSDRGRKPVQSSGNLSSLALPNIRIDVGVPQDRGLDIVDAREEDSVVANATAEQKNGTIPGQLSSKCDNVLMVEQELLARHKDHLLVKSKISDEIVSSAGVTNVKRRRRLILLQDEFDEDAWDGDVRQRPNQENSGDGLHRVEHHLKKSKGTQENSGDDLDRVEPHLETSKGPLKLGSEWICPVTHVGGPEESNKNVPREELSTGRIQGTIQSAQQDVNVGCMAGSDGQLLNNIKKCCICAADKFSDDHLKKSEKAKKTSIVACSSTHWDDLNNACDIVGAKSQSEHKYDAECRSHGELSSRDTAAETKLAYHFESVHRETCRIPVQPTIPDIWRGSFQVGNKEYGIVGAHLSTRACQRVWDMSESLLPILLFEKVPRAAALPKAFITMAPSEDHIGLFFFPVESRINAIFDALVCEVIDGDLMLKSTLDAAELLIFPSTLLPEEYRNFQGKYYLWGAFRGRNDLTQGTDILAERVSPCMRAKITASVHKDPKKAVTEEAENHNFCVIVVHPEIEEGEIVELSDNTREVVYRTENSLSEEVLEKYVAYVAEDLGEAAHHHDEELNEFVISDDGSAKADSRPVCDRFSADLKNSMAIPLVSHEFLENSCGSGNTKLQTPRVQECDAQGQYKIFGYTMQNDHAILNVPSNMEADRESDHSRSTLSCLVPTLTAK